MKLRYHIATLSFCPDLLDPEAASIPVGILLLAEAAGQGVALLAVDKNLPLSEALPPVVREIVGQFPQLVQAQLESILQSDAGANIDTIMEVFEDSLRNSFYVSDLQLNQIIDIPDFRSGVAREKWLYEPTTRVAAASVAAAIEEPWAMDYRYRPWHPPTGSHSGRVSAK